MFDPGENRLFALPPGVDFATELAQGLRDRLAGSGPDAMARVTVFVNADRMRARLRAAFDAGPATLLPRIRLVTDIADPAIRATLPQPVPPLRRRLQITRLVAALLEAEPDLAPRSALYGLSDSLAKLLEEMQTEDVAPETLEQLDVSDQSGHWQRALRFLQIAQDFASAADAPDRAGYARRALTTLIAGWEARPPQDPVIIAGSTGSRGTTYALMQATAALPQGAIILPGFDTTMPQAVWDKLDGPLGFEDHPQYRYAKLMRDLGLRASEVRAWTTTHAPAPDRNAVLSLALRPAPVTHQWLSEGPNLPDLGAATSGITLLEAPSPRDEARAIALRLRQAAEDGQSAALVSPDRVLTRQVTAALDRWRIVPDDSAGTPAHLTPAGRFLRHTAALFAGPLTAEALLTILKHPLAHSGADRNTHLLATRALELHIRANAWAYPQAEALRGFASIAAKRGLPGPADWQAWTDWVAAGLCLPPETGLRPLADRVAAHRALAETLAAGAGQDGAGALWQGNQGKRVAAILQGLADEAAHGTDMTARDYVDFLNNLLSDHEVPDPTETHSGIRIWGTLEARAMGADLMILAGLNEGSWPGAPEADPWLNRTMWAEAGLLVPERQTGLSAHDFQQAAAGAEVWLTRAVKSDDAETVPSRWVNRLTNMLAGLPATGGPAALAAKRARGSLWVAMAKAAEAPNRSAKAPRPAPAPPLSARPKSLSVTEIKTLIRDPYAIYARHVLGLKPLEPLMRLPDALLRGILVHEILEQALADGHLPDADDLRRVAAGILGDPLRLPSPTERIRWRVRFDSIADWFAQTEAIRQAKAKPTLTEAAGAADLPLVGFTLRARLDRLDQAPDGSVHLYDYKTGAVPSEKQQKAFDKQLLLTAAMLEQGGFDKIGPATVARAAFIGLSPADQKEVAAPLADTPPAQVWAELGQLIAAYSDRQKGYAARRAMLKDSDAGRYDHLARYGEWDLSDPAQPEELG